jgi:hypothetical protein
MNKTLAPRGYIQKGNRYFLKWGATTKYNQGFRSKQDFCNWIDEKRDEYGFDWQAGALVKFKQFDQPFLLVDRSGKEVKF